MLYKIFLILSSAYLITVAVTAESNKDSLTNKSDYVISVQNIQIDDMRVNDTIDILLNSKSNGLAGFDLKIVYQPGYFIINEIIPGHLSEFCQWDLFNARQLKPKDELKQLDIWQIVAIADISPDSEKPSCYGVENQVSIARLVLSNKHVQQVPDTIIPIVFLWEDCTDNTISGVSGNILNLSNNVFEYYKLSTLIESEPFPSTKGSSENCLKPGSLNQPRRSVDFHNGIVEFLLKIEK